MSDATRPSASAQPVHHRHHAVHRHPAPHPRPLERLHQGLRQRQPARLDHDVIDPRLQRQDPVQRRHEVVRHRAADAPVGQLDDVLVRAPLHPAAPQDLPVDPDVAELVHDHREPPPPGILQHMPDQRRLPRPEKPGDDGAGNAGQHRSWQLLQDVGIGNAGDQPALQRLGPRPERHEPVGRLREEPRPRDRDPRRSSPPARRRHSSSSRCERPPPSARACSCRGRPPAAPPRRSPPPPAACPSTSALPGRVSLSGSSGCRHELQTSTVTSGPRRRERDDGKLGRGHVVPLAPVTRRAFGQVHATAGLLARGSPPMAAFPGNPSGAWPRTTAHSCGYSRGLVDALDAPRSLFVPRGDRRPIH